MKVLLLNPPYAKHFIRSARWAAKSISGSNWYPIWLAYCTGLLEKDEHEAKLIDALIEGYSIAKMADIAKSFLPQLTVIYVSTASIESDAQTAHAIKQSTGSQIVMVGPWCAVDPEAIIGSSKAVDAIALYEFDFTILEIAQGKEFRDIKGLWWKDGDNIVKNPARTPLTPQQLNEFPFVTDVYRRHLNLRKYFQAPQLYPFVDLFTGRGCAWGKCIFCLWPFTLTHGAPYRLRKIDNVIKEIEFIKKELPFVKEVFIQDDTFPAERAKEFSHALIKNNIKIIWSCYSRANLDFDTLNIMKHAGCRGLHVGYESSDPRVLKLINKGVTRQEMEAFTESAYKLGFIIHADFIVGLPGDTEDTIRETIKWAKQLKAHSYQFVTPKVYRNTPLSLLEDKHADKNRSQLCDNELNYWMMRAIRECHFNFGYLFRILKHPAEIRRVLKGAWFVIWSAFNK